MSASEIGSQVSSVNELEMVIQKRYLQTHLLLFTKADNQETNFDDSLEDHIVNII